METVVIVIHLMIVVALVVVVLWQRSEGGALGIGGGSGGFMSSRGAANALTRATTFLAVCFFATSIMLTILAHQRTTPSEILDAIPAGSGPEALGNGNGILDTLRQQNPDSNLSGPQVPEE